MYNTRFKTRSVLTEKKIMPVIYYFTFVPKPKSFCKNLPFNGLFFISLASLMENSLDFSGISDVYVCV